MTTAYPQDHLRVQVAFTTAPDDPSPLWEDISAYVDLTAGVSITTGRSDEYATIQTGSCTVNLNNTDGRFTAGNTASPYYPNVKVRKKLRVYWRDPAILGNLVDAESASFEGGSTGLWSPSLAGTKPPTITNSATRAHNGIKSMLVTWPAAAATESTATWPIDGLTVGQKYTFAVWVFVPTGHPPVQFYESLPNIGGTGSTSTTTNAWQQLTATFTATTPTNWLSVILGGTATAGQQVWVDGFQGDEGSVVPAFTTIPPPLQYRFCGYVEEWPCEWPTGGDTYAAAQVTASDRFKRLGKAGPFRSVVEQEYLLDAPAAYYTLGEAAGTTAGDTSKMGGAQLATSQVGAGGALTFGANTGPGTDSLPAPAFIPVNVSNGKQLLGVCPPVTRAITVEAFVLTSTSAGQTVVRVLDDVNGYIQIGISATGKATATCYDQMIAGPFYTLTSSVTVANGLTHHIAVTHDYTAFPNVTATLVVDGVSAGAVVFYPDIPTYTVVNVGGVPGGALFTGTISHVAISRTPLSVARLLSHYQAGATGFAGCRSDQRIARLASYSGIPTTEQNLEVGQSTSISFVDITGAGALTAMQDVASTEGGVLFIDGAGLLVFQARGHRYNTASTFTIDAADIDPGAHFAVNDLLMINDVTANRPGGATFRAVAADSIADYGTAHIDVTLLVTTDAEVVDAATWKANQSSTINPRLPNLTMDLLTSPALTAAALLLGISSRITLSGLPAQSPASSVDLFVEGIAETISTSGWLLTLNTSPSADSSAWILDDALYSVLGTSTKLTY